VEQKPLTHTSRHLLPTRRLTVLVVALFLAGVAAWSADLHHLIVHAVEWIQPLITNHSVWGAFLFAGLAALSAVLAFFSSVVLVPIGVYVWGETTCFLLLWTGWLLGGMLTYTIGRRLGWPIVRWLLSARVAAKYESRIPESRRFLPVLLFQLALPSEGAGYLCGLFRVPPLTYLAALAVAELPYALGTVLLGTAFFRREYPMLLAVGLAGLLWLGWLHWRQRPSRNDRAP
jgi:uncharacterized membrane protein YdjX (TVP38/TMEM64 family)